MKFFINWYNYVNYCKTIERNIQNIQNVKRARSLVQKKISPAFHGFYSHAQAILAQYREGLLGLEKMTHEYQQGKIKQVLRLYREINKEFQMK